MNAQKILHDCKNELHGLELRATPARVAVMQLLESTDKPVDVSMIITYLEENNIKTDPATAFRIINLFMEKGLVKKISFNEGKFRYELSSKGEHHHLVCESCGKIESFEDCAIPELEKDIKTKKGFLVQRHSLEFFGLCLDCQK